MKCSRSGLSATGCNPAASCAAQGAASGKELQPLPQHRFSPHDMVALRPARGEPGGPVVAAGVVYRLQETAVVIAVDEAPDDGLEQPLRLEKLANDVSLLSDASVEASRCGAVCTWSRLIVDTVKQLSLQTQKARNSVSVLWLFCVQVTYQRLQAALTALGGGSGGDQLRPGTALAEVVFSGEQPRFQTSPPPWQPLNSGSEGTAPSCRLMSTPPIARGSLRMAASVDASMSGCDQSIDAPCPGLDDSQRAAVSLALAAQDVALIHGPPGTGVSALSHRRP
jgi:ATP-dependent RNA/DNA helicase IGHMBP2